MPPPHPSLLGRDAGRVTGCCRGPFSTTILLRQMWIGCDSNLTSQQLLCARYPFNPPPPSPYFPEVSVSLTRNCWLLCRCAASHSGSTSNYPSLSSYIERAEKARLQLYYTTRPLSQVKLHNIRRI